MLGLTSEALARPLESTLNLTFLPITPEERETLEWREEMRRLFHRAGVCSLQEVVAVLREARG